MMDKDECKCWWCQNDMLEIGHPQIAPTPFDKAWDRWSSFGYIYVNQKYGKLGSFIGTGLGRSAEVPNN